MKKYVVLVILLLLTSACSRYIRSSAVTTKGKVDINSSFYVIYPKNGYKYEASNLAKAAGSITGSKTVANMTAKPAANLGSASEAMMGFERFAKSKKMNVNYSAKNISLEEGLRQAKSKNAKYLVDMAINEWHDEFFMSCSVVSDSNQTTHYNTVLQTEDLPHGSDIFDITMSVYDVNTGKLVNQQRLQNGQCPPSILHIIPLGSTKTSTRFKQVLNSKWVSGLNKK